MMARAILKKISSQDGLRYVELSANADGLFRFTEFLWKPSQDSVDREFHGDGYWSFGLMSGLYATIEEAEAGARHELPWLGSETRK